MNVSIKILYVMDDSVYSFFFRFFSSYFERNKDKNLVSDSPQLKMNESMIFGRF